MIDNMGLIIYDILPEYGAACECIFKSVKWASAAIILKITATKIVAITTLLH